MIEEIIEFENIIKKYKSLFFDKVWEKHKDIWKLIYNIQGLVVDNKFYSNLKIIFWYNNDKTELSENVITFLYSQNCEYRTIKISNISLNIKAILNMIYNEETNKYLSDLIIGGVDPFNKLIKDNGINDFIQTIEFIPHGNVSCIQTIFKFDLVSNTDTYTFMIKFIEDKMNLLYSDTEIQIDKNQLYKELIRLIYEA